MPVTELELKPFVEFEVILGAGTNDYAKHIASCRLTPTGGTETRWKGGTPTAKAAHRNESDWTCEMRVAQDFSATGLATYLMANEATTVAAQFTPIAGGSTWYVDLILSAPGIGGDIDTFGESTVTHTCVTKPSTTPPV